MTPRLPSPGDRSPGVSQSHREASGAERSPGRETSRPRNTSYATGTTAATSHFSSWSFDAQQKHAERGRRGDNEE
jgi:hypothetical protein